MTKPPLPPAPAPARPASDEPVERRRPILKPNYGPRPTG